MALPLAGLAGKTAIITGAGSGTSPAHASLLLPIASNILKNNLGINLSFARALLTKHCNVLFADLALRPKAQELVSNHANQSQSPAKAVFQKTDVRDWQQLEPMFHVASKEFGGADIVCPGAGVYEPVRTTKPLLALNSTIDVPVALL